MAKDDGEVSSQGPKYVKVSELRPEGVESGCLRPLGLCDLGGCCDICFYGYANEARPESEAGPGGGPPTDSSS